MPNPVVNFLTRQARLMRFRVGSSVSGSIVLTDQAPIKQSFGAVYGIAAMTRNPPEGWPQPLPYYPSVYPIYWGKDIAPVSRLKAHVQGHRNNGNIGIRDIPEINGLELIFGGIFVSRYEVFEEYLHNNFPPLRGTGRLGSRLRVIEVTNDA